ncbi:MAG: UDP-N-acetylmuramate dehydrogenase [Chloroflexi bacterium]|nr:UDP-N-acetylmuramate dehydrogenase [Chloroflexota bacterium]
MGKLKRDFLEKLSALGAAARQEPMAHHTTFRIGGPADCYILAKGKEHLVSIVELARTYEVPYFILGAGSNILVSDQGLRGLVISNMARQTKVLEPGLFEVEAGSRLTPLARRWAKAGWEGLEWAVGIPGTIGGAAVYNAGAHGGCLAQVLKAAHIFDSQGQINKVEASQLGLDYRHSLLRQQKVTILSLEVNLHPGNAPELEERMANFVAKRRQSQPQKPSAGSVFKNPPGYAAGWLIEQVGLKGRRQGDAQISPRHANFIVNLGQAKASEVQSLIQLAQERVQREFSIALELEIEIWGERA